MGDVLDCFLPSVAGAWGRLDGCVSLRRGKGRTVLGSGPNPNGLRLPSELVPLACPFAFQFVQHPMAERGICGAPFTIAAQRLEGAPCLPTVRPPPGRSSNGYVHLDGAHRERHPLLRSHFEAPNDGLSDVRDRLIFGLPLADAARNRGALGDDHVGFVAFEDYRQLHLVPFRPLP